MQQTPISTPVPVPTPTPCDPFETELLAVLPCLDQDGKTRMQLQREMADKGYPMTNQELNRLLYSMQARKLCSRGVENPPLWNKLQGSPAKLEDEEERWMVLIDLSTVQDIPYSVLEKWKGVSVKGYCDANYTGSRPNITVFAETADEYAVDVALCWDIIDMLNMRDTLSYIVCSRNKLFEALVYEASGRAHDITLIRCWEDLKLMIE